MVARKRKILVVDDDEAVFEYLARKVGDLYDFVTTTEPESALELAINEMPDLVLCDIDMPEFDGGVLSNQFADCPLTRNVPFAYLTSFVSPYEVEKLRGNVGGRPGIAKATAAPLMIAIIEKLMRRSH